jgi:hypothetical protein
MTDLVLDQNKLGAGMFEPWKYAARMAGGKRYKKSNKKSKRKSMKSRRRTRRLYM